MKLLRNDFFIAFLLLLAYLATNPYIYGWDDQHLEIPILKHLIDPSLYKGDYYVESAAKYFTCWLYPLLAKIITVKQVPAAYLVLFLISRYWMFYWVFRLWLWVSGSAFSAVCTTMTFMLLGRTDEFLYRSFCHEEFSFIFMFAGLYYFYRERYLTAALIFGLTVNFHAIYGLIPMLYLLAYLLFCHPQRFKMVFQTGLAFVLASLPFLCWQIPISISREVAHPVAVNEWMPLYLLACPQNFLFGATPLQEIWGDIHVGWQSMAPYLFLMGLYIFHLVFNPSLRRDKKLNTIVGFSWAILAVLYFFDYVSPSRFVLDLNLIRVEQYTRFFLMGYTTLWACEQVRASKPWLALFAAILVLACGMVDPTKVPLAYWYRYIFIIAAMAVVFLALLVRKESLWLRRLLIIIPVAGTVFICVYNHYMYRQLVAHGPSGWQLQRNWEDMQFYVRDHTPKDAMILTPYDMPMGGFRIHSERKVLVCYRDCGIIGFDYAAAVEWNKRIMDIAPFRVFSREGVDEAVMTAIVKYNVNYVVFMNYYEPPGDTDILKKIYENEVFSLFQVI